MGQLLNNQQNSADDPVSNLQKEIAELEANLEKVSRELGAFEAKIHARLDKQIARIRELFELYKKQKREKKAKRLEQKKRGKNYKEPKQVVHHSEPEGSRLALSLDEQRELKRLYKEAVVQVHPDKFIQAGEHDKIQRANAVTAQLNGIYKRGDLEELINFYQYIISGNAVFETTVSLEPVVDPRVRLETLKRKKEALLEQLQHLRSSYTYTVLTSYENPLSFIDELEIQFQERILKLEKRTKKG